MASKNVEEIYGLSSTGAAVPDTSSIKSAIKPLPEERITTAPIAAFLEKNSDYQDGAWPENQRFSSEPKGLTPPKDETMPAADPMTESTGATGLPMSGIDPTINMPRANTGNAAPAQEGALSTWWKSLPPDHRAALQKSLLVTGLSLMAQNRPSRIPVTTSSIIAQAGLTGFGEYERSMELSARHAERKNLIEVRNRHVAMEEQRLRLEVEKARRQEDLDSPGSPATTQANPYLSNGSPTTLDSNLNVASEKRGLSLTSGDATAPRGATGLPSLNTDSVNVPAKPPGLHYQEKQATIAEKKAQTEKLAAETENIGTGAFKPISFQDQENGPYRSALYNDKSGEIKVVGGATPKQTGIKTNAVEPRDRFKEGALKSAQTAAANHLKVYPDEEEVANKIANSLYQQSLHLQMGHEFQPGTPGTPGVKSLFFANKPGEPPIPGRWVDQEGKETPSVIKDKDIDKHLEGQGTPAAPAKKGLSVPPRGAITLPSTVTTTSQAIDHLMKNNGMSREQAIAWIRSQG